MNHVDLFSGIGGFSIAVDEVWPGSTHTFVEFDPFCQAVLTKNFPNSHIHGDIRQFNASAYAHHDGSTISESKLRQQSLKALGNSIVPQVAIEIMRAIKGKE